MVTEPRLPCYKLGLKFGRDDMVKRFLKSRRTGFYCAVLREGEVLVASGAHLHVTGAEPHPGGGVLGRTAVPGAGELFTLPTLSLSGVCQALMVEAVPGGPLDRPLGRGATGEDVLEGLLDVLRAHAPWEYERFAHARLADPMAALRGGYTPAVREPVARLAGGTPSWGWPTRW